MAKSLTLLKKTDLLKNLKKIPQWSIPAKGTLLQKSIVFTDHIDALVFIARITVHAQVLNHHPEIIFTYKKVKVILTTHECKGISLLDIEFAKRIDLLITKSG